MDVSGVKGERIRATALLLALSVGACSPHQQSPNQAPPERASRGADVRASIAPAPAREVRAIDAGSPVVPTTGGPPCFKRGDRGFARDHDGEALGIAWAHRPGRLAVICEGHPVVVEVVDVPSLTVIARAPATNRTRFGAFRGDDGAMILREEDATRIWDFAGHTMNTVPGLPEATAQFTFSTAFDRLAWSTDNGDVTVLDPARGTTLARLHPTHDNHGVHLALSDDGELLALIGESLTIHRAATGELVSRWSPAKGTRVLGAPKWTEDGAALFFKTASVESLLALPEPGEPPYFGTPVDDQRRHEVRRWNVKARRVDGSWPAVDFAITPSGRVLATSGSCAVTRIDLATGARRELERGQASDCLYTYAGMGVSADGRVVSGTISRMSGTSSAVFDAAGGHPSWLQ